MNISRVTSIVVIVSSGWLLLSNGISLIVATASPHGLAAFVYAGFFLGILGLVIQLLHFLGSTLNRFRFSVGLNSLVGFVSGATSFVTAAWYQGTKSFTPMDVFGAVLLLYLCILGATISSLIALAIIKLQAASKTVRSDNRTRPDAS
jgi:hypothetical protein